MKRAPHIASLLLVLALVLAVLPNGSAFALDDLVGPVTSLVTATPNPAAIGDTVTVTATVDDTTTGASNILSAEFSVNGGAWTPMTAVDGAFDSATEAVTGTFTAAAGDNQVCVQGTDVANNVGAPVCVTFASQSIYTFGGFLPPLRSGAMSVKAGRNLPVKFKLSLTAGGTPVRDRSVITGLMSYAVDCTTQVGDPTTAVLEKGPGKAAMKVNPHGRWLIHWKTSKSYKNTCRLMFVQFVDGSMSPTVFFSFR